MKHYDVTLVKKHGRLEIMKIFIQWMDYRWLEHTTYWMCGWIQLGEYITKQSRHIRQTQT